MAREKKPLTLLVQRNLFALIEHSELSVNAWCAQYPGLVQTTVNRIVTGNLDPSASQVEKIAKAIGMEPWKLFVEGFEPANPPALKKLSAQEQALYDKLMADVKELAAFNERNTGHGDLPD